VIDYELARPRINGVVHRK